MNSKTVLITGGSSGIGFELAKIFGKNDYNLLLVARNKEKLEMASEQLRNYAKNIITISKDLSDPHSPTQIYEQLQNEKIQIDVLVNNAGFGTYGLFTETSTHEELSELQVNIVSFTHLTKLLVRDMVKRGSGKILNVASTAAFTPGPLMAVYYASKAYVLSFSEALREELKGTGVDVAVLCPGPTDTGFIRRGGVWNSKLFQGKHMNASSVAKDGYSGLMKNNTIIIPGWSNKVFVQGLRFVPRSIAPKILVKLQSKV